MNETSRELPGHMYMPGKLAARKHLFTCSICVTGHTNILCFFENIDF
uniref:Uncharacterized protein n=1 Tax=Arundo donax TaxID=35708 RepID=A0A0A8ZLV0_ARUDO